MTNKYDVGYDCFLGCTSLEHVNLTNKFVSSGDNIFNSCTSLTEVGDLSGLESISYGFFNDCISLTQDIDISNVSIVYRQAFFRCILLKKITMSNKCTSVGWNSFGTCNSLEEIGDTSGVTHVDDYTFEKCYNLRNTNFPKVEYIGDGAFNTCKSFTNFIIPDTCTYIGGWILAYCSSILYIKCLAIIPPTAKDNTVFRDTNNCPIYVPDSSVESYKSATNWSNYSARIKPLSEFIQET